MADLLDDDDTATPFSGPLPTPPPPPSNQSSSNGGPPDDLLQQKMMGIEHGEQFDETMAPLPSRRDRFTSGPAAAAPPPTLGRANKPSNDLEDDDDDDCGFSDMPSTNQSSSGVGLPDDMLQQKMMSIDIGEQFDETMAPLPTRRRQFGGNNEPPAPAPQEQQKMAPPSLGMAPPSLGMAPPPMQQHTSPPPMQQQMAPPPMQQQTSLPVLENLPDDGSKLITIDGDEAIVSDNEEFKSLVLSYEVSCLFDQSSKRVFGFKSLQNGGHYASAQNKVQPVAPQSLGTVPPPLAPPTLAPSYANPTQWNVPPPTLPMGTPTPVLGRHHNTTPGDLEGDDDLLADNLPKPGAVSVGGPPSVVKHMDATASDEKKSAADIEMIQNICGVSLARAFELYEAASNSADRAINLHFSG